MVGRYINWKIKDSLLNQNGGFNVIFMSLIPSSFKILYLEIYECMSYKYDKIIGI